MPAHISGLRGWRVVLAASVLVASGLGATACSSQAPEVRVAAAPALSPVVQQAAKPAGTATQTAKPAAPPIAKPAQPGAKPAAPAAKGGADDLPPVSWICTMPGDEAVLEDKPGKCPNPKCGMDLKPIRIVAGYKCLNNTFGMQRTPGKCKTDGTDMVQANLSLYWNCPSTPDVHEINPGKCADGTARIEQLELRAHGDHNPRHGGQFFMAPDAWHHLEGTYPSAGLFRVYFYDDYTKPMLPKGFVSRIVIRDAAGKDVATVPLKASRITNALEAQIPTKAPTTAAPVVTQLQIVFKAGGAENKFDFAFPVYSKEPARGATPPAPQGRGTAANTGRGRGAQPPAPAAPTTESPFMAPQSGQGLMTIPGGGTFEMIAPNVPQEEPIPNTAKDILAELAGKTEEVETLIRQGGNSLGAVWVPALRSKALALALLENYVSEIPDRMRPTAESAVKRLMLAAFQIDTLGDLGNQNNILTVQAEFSAAVSDLNTAYASLR